MAQSEVVLCRLELSAQQPHVQTGTHRPALVCARSSGAQLCVILADPGSFPSNSLEIHIREPLSGRISSMLCSCEKPGKTKFERIPTCWTIWQNSTWEPFHRQLDVTDPDCKTRSHGVSRGNAHLMLLSHTHIPGITAGTAPPLGINAVSSPGQNPPCWTYISSPPGTAFLP